MAEEPLTEEEVRGKMENLEIWGVEDNKLATRIEFNDYKEACFFANTVFSLAEKNFHHPKVSVEYDAVEIDLWSHDVEGLTEKDFQLAEEVEDALKSI
ncbi:MAG: 4a-hydroxytetrahydrobiopterin dehydratase [Candidatus Nanohalobium sp.]